MRKKYHTLEELRGALAGRQARWRERNRGYERVRARSNYNKSRAGGDGAAAGEGGRGTDGEAVVHGGGWGEAVVTLDVPRGKLGEETDEERRVNEQLGVLRARQAAGGLNAGVEVELEL